MNIFPDILLTTDAHHYGILAQNIISGNGFTLAGNPELIFPPGFSFLLLPFLLFLNPNHAVLLLMCIGFISLVCAVYLLSQKYFNKVTAIIAATIIALNGNIILYTLVGYAEVLMFAVLLFAFYFWDQQNNRKLVIAGSFFGIAYLIKPEALFYMSIFIGVHFFIKKLEVNKNLLYFIIPILICISGYSAFLYSSSGKLALSGKVATLEWDRYIENPSIGRDSIQYRINEDGSLGPSIRMYDLTDVNFYQRIQTNLRTLKQGVFEVLLPFKYVFVAILLAFMFAKKHRKILSAVLLLNIPVGLTLIFHIENRYLFPILLTTIVTLSVLASYITTTLEKKRNFLTIGAAVFSIICLGLMTYYSYYPLRSDYSSLIEQQKETLEWLTNNPVGREIILARKPVYSFLVSRDYAPFPYGTDERSLSTYFDKFDDETSTIILDRWSYYAMPEVHRMILEDFESGQKKIIKNKQVLIFENWD